MSGVNRRKFFQYAAGGAAGVAVSGAALHTVSRVNQALENEIQRVPGGEEAWHTAICTLCPAGCGLRVRTIGGRAVKIQGNPLHPVNRGGICPKGQAGLQELYHPDRLREPLKNTGTREAPKWRTTSWEEAMGTVTARLRQLRAARQPNALVTLSPRGRPLFHRLLQQFAAAHDSPHAYRMPSGLDAIHGAMRMQQGISGPVAYDLEHSRYVLSFGADLLEGWGSPCAVMRSFGHWRDSSLGRRSKLVQIESRYSITAARADEWVALQPGTEAALALGIAYVLITEGLIDDEFVAEHTFGYEDWTDAAGRTHSGFRSLVTSEYRLNDVAARTGVPAATILRVAREFGRNRPAVAIGDRQTSTLAGDPYAAMAVNALNALAGSVDAPGGVLVPVPTLAADAPAADGASPGEFPAGVPGASRLATDIVGARLKPQVMLLFESNPVFALGNGQAFARAMRQVPFIVSFSSFMDETAALADVVLPVATGLERWQESDAPPAFPYRIQSIAPPVLPARHRTRDAADLVLELARAAGGPVAAALPQAKFEDYLRVRADAIFAERSFSVFSSTIEETWNRLLQRSGWWAPTYSTAEEFWNQVRENGGCWEPSYFYRQWERVFNTPSGKFEFYSQKLQQWSDQHPEFARRCGLERGDDRIALPHQPSVPEPGREYPLQLQVFEVLPLAGGEGAHLPYLQQIAGPHLFEQWESWLEIHPETAHTLRLEDRDEVWVESPRGRARVRARLYEGARPGVVYLPLGFGHTEGGEWARRGLNPLELFEESYEPLAGTPRTVSTFVKVYKA